MFDRHFLASEIQSSILVKTKASPGHLKCWCWITRVIKDMSKVLQISKNCVAENSAVVRCELTIYRCRLHLFNQSAKPAICISWLHILHWIYTSKSPKFYSGLIWRVSAENNMPIVLFCFIRSRLVNKYIRTEACLQLFLMHECWNMCDWQTCITYIADWVTSQRKTR